MLLKFQALLDKMEASDMPETVQYRVDVTKWCNYVIQTVRANPNDPEAVEDAVNMGQVEELIDMADDEMVCLDTYLKVRMWEHVIADPHVTFTPNPMADPMSETGDAKEQERYRKGMEPLENK
jgi:NADH dehydrogenase (ubiquinone) 1 alpha subcomplex subunit 5